MWQKENNTFKALQTLGELSEQVLAISNNSLEEARSDVEETKSDQPYPALISINMSSGCEESVQAIDMTLPIVDHNFIPYIDEVSVY